MNEMWTAMIQLQAQALELQRRQMDAAQQWLSAGEDMVASQKKGMEASVAGQKAWKSWLGLWGVKG